MKYIKKCKKYILVSILIILILLVFTACGAEINTEMKFDKNFKGERTITAFIKKTDLNNYVPTGADGIEDVIKRYIPESVSYKRIDKGEGDTEFVFYISFDNLEDYTKKITEILNKNPDNTIKANIIYENKNNEFKKSMLFEENFSSNDLLSWLVYGLKAEGTVSHSFSSQWIEQGKSLLKIENQDYNVSGNFRVKESELSSFDKINVMTEILESGNFKRKITFLMADKNNKILSDRGLVVADYLKGILPENAELEEVKEESNIKYIISFETETANELSLYTDRLFNSQNSFFSINYSSYENRKDVVRLDVEECIDASYYLNYDSNNLKSDIYFYGNMSLDFDNTINNIHINNLYDNSAFSYNPSSYDIHKFTFSLPIQPQNLSLGIDLNNNNISEKLSMSISRSFPDELIEIIEDNIKSSIDSDKIKLDIKKEENLIVYTLSLNDTIDEVSKEFKRFLSNYLGHNINHEISYREIDSKSVFKRDYSLNIIVDLSRFNANKINFYCKPVLTRKFEILESSNITELESSTNRSVVSEVNGGIIHFYALETGIKFISVIILLLSIIVLAIILCYIIMKRDKIKSLFKKINKRKLVSADIEKSIDAIGVMDTIGTMGLNDESVALTDTSDEEIEQDEDEDEFI